MVQHCRSNLEAICSNRWITMQENLVKTLKSNNIKAPLSEGTDDEVKSMPSWKSDDFKSWIWMQKAMHPELNYNRCFRKKWSLQLPKKLVPFKEISIKKWVKEMKQKRKEEKKLQKAEVHATVSVASVAAALAAVAAENAKTNQSSTTKETAVASAAALIAAQCAQAAEDMGANRQQLRAAIGSAMASTDAADIYALTAAATTSLRGAGTLRARPGSKERVVAPTIPFEENKELGFDYNKYMILLAKGSELTVRTSDGKCKLRFVSIILNSEAKVILKVRKINLLKGEYQRKYHPRLTRGFDQHSRCCISVPSSDDKSGDNHARNERLCSI